MSQFVFLYRFADAGPVSPQQMQERMKAWTQWMKGLDEKGRLVSNGLPLAPTGAVVKDDRGGFHDGPYAETKDLVMGFSVIEATDLAEARALAAGNPILKGGGLVEIRPVRSM